MFRTYVLNDDDVLCFVPLTSGLMIIYSNGKQAEGHRRGHDRYRFRVSCLQTVAIVTFYGSPWSRRAEHSWSHLNVHKYERTCTREESWFMHWHSRILGPYIHARAERSASSYHIKKTYALCEFSCINSSNSQTDKLTDLQKREFRSIMNEHLEIRSVRL